MGVAKGKDIKVHMFIFDSSCSEDSAYPFIAANTGGGYFPLAKSQAGAITTLVDKVARANHVSIIEVIKVDAMYAKEFKKRADATYDIAVDSAMSAITFALSGVGTNLSVARPDNTVVGAADSGVTLIDLGGRGILLSVNAPASGMWRVTVGGNLNASLSVTGLSSLHFSEFDVVEYRGRPNHEGWFPINGSAAAGSIVNAIGLLEGGFSDVKYDLRDVAGKVISNFDLFPGSGDVGEPPKNAFFGTFTVPNRQAFVCITGKDAAGAPYQRCYPVPLLANGTAFPPSNSTNTTSSSILSSFTTAPSLFPNSTATSLGPTAIISVTTTLM